MTEENHVDLEKLVVKEKLAGIGNQIEKAIEINQNQYLSEESAKYIRENTGVKFNVFQEGWVDESIAGEEVRIGAERAMTGSVLEGRTLLLLGAIGEEKLKGVMMESLSLAMTVKGGGIGDEMSTAEAIEYANRFIKKGCERLKFSYGVGETDEEKNVIHRLEAIVNGAYYMLATAALEGEDFKYVQEDLLLSANLRLPVLKGIERGKEKDQRHIVPGFAQAAPIRHLPSGCLGMILKQLA